MGFHICNYIYLGSDPTTFHQEHNDYELLVEPYFNQFPAQSFIHDPNNVLTLLFKHTLLKLWGVRKHF